jgi:ABC-2 type transport system ATP-binding protein
METPMTDPEAPAITVRGLTKRYGDVAALTDVHFDVPAGSIFGFLGRNGAGKSTTIKILAGLTHATSGSATVAGIPVTAQGSHRRALGYLAQEPRFYDWMTGRETLHYVARYYPEIGDPRRRAAELLDLVGIADAADRKTGTYSGGMRQRLGIAQALVGRPAVVVLDEPAAALDPLGRRDVLTLLESLRGEATVLYSTHILEDVQRVSDHVAIVDCGRLVRAQPTRDLLESFSRDRLVVQLGNATPATAVALAGLPDVTGVTPAGQPDGPVTYAVSTRPDAIEAVQARITRFAVDAGLVLITNMRETLDLESVFLRLVDPKEVAA